MSSGRATFLSLRGRMSSFGGVTKRLMSLVFLAWALVGDGLFGGSGESGEQAVAEAFRKDVLPLLKEYCYGCHGEKKAKAGIRVDYLDGSVPDKEVRHWEVIREQLAEEEMPPEDEAQPSEAQRAGMVAWIDEALLMARARTRPKNGGARRLTVAQYRNTLRDLLGIEEDLTGVLPPDGVSKDGFVNNGKSMLLSPLLVGTYFEIAERALDLAIVNPEAKPVIQNFRVDLGRAINPEPCPDKLILGAFNHLLANDAFVVRQLAPEKPFAFTPFKMRTQWRFNEGYQGNATVRGWREYDSIYHAVFFLHAWHQGLSAGQGASGGGEWFAAATGDSQCGGLAGGQHVWATREFQNLPA